MKPITGFVMIISIVLIFVYVIKETHKYLSTSDFEEIQAELIEDFMIEKYSKTYYQYWQTNECRRESVCKLDDMNSNDKADYEKMLVELKYNPWEITKK